uniref:AT-rich interactive domain-containing protein 6-like n=1 Tax=Erigeron canadensis TaxID=72917 RepID=UPI001CB8B823|nr:AT-rich interactive domain-containing protein 6-like [Erigeron canadensis]
MDQKDVEMEDAGKILEDEVVDGKECLKKDELAGKDAGDSPKQIGLGQEEEEYVSTISTEEIKTDVSEQNLPLDTPQDSEKEVISTGDEIVRDTNEATATADDDMINDSKDDITETADDDCKNDVTNLGDDDKLDSKNDATDMADDDKLDRKNDITETADDDCKNDVTNLGDDDKLDDGKNGATVTPDDDKIHDHKNNATEKVSDVKIDDSKNSVTEVGDDDKIDKGKNDGTEMGDDDKIDDSKNDATEKGDNDKVYERKSDAIVMAGDDKNDATELGDDDKIDDSKIDATMAADDDKVDDSTNNATEIGHDAKVDGSKTDVTDMDEDRHMMEETDYDSSMKLPESNNVGDNAGDEKHQELPTPNALVNYSPSKVEYHSAKTPKSELEYTKIDEGYESGTAEEQETFMREVEAFYRAKGIEFKPPKFYGQHLNCLKLWRSVIKLGGYDRVTGSKWWRQVGEAFHPPKTCTTVSWTFRIFYEKALLEFERHKVQTGEVELPLAIAYPESPAVEIETNGHLTPGSGSGRARRDAASRAMQGWHSQRLLGLGEEKNSQKRDKSFKSLGSLKQKRPSEVEHSVKAARTETSRQVVTTVADIGPPASWVKVNVRETKDCFEVYALVPGLLREEVRVQSDPAGRLVITGQPEQLDNPWGITAFKKVISLPGRIDPLRTSAIVSLHGRLLVRVPFEQPNI